MADVEEKGQSPDPAIIQRAAQFSAATLSEALGKGGTLPSSIKPISAGMKVCGAAITVSSPRADNLTLHQAIYLARPGDVMVVEVSGFDEAGYWGDIMTHAALERRLAGLVIDGCVRDADDVERAGFSVFARGLCVRSTSKHGGGFINRPIKIGEVTIAPGDIVVGDRDGVVVIPQLEVDRVIAAAEQREQCEQQIRKELAAGKTTLEIYGWPVPDESKPSAI